MTLLILKNLYIQEKIGHLDNFYNQINMTCCENLLWAVHNKHKECLKLLLEKGAIHDKYMVFVTAMFIFFSILYLDYKKKKIFINK